MEASAAQHTGMQDSTSLQRTGVNSTRGPQQPALPHLATTAKGYRKLGSLDVYLALTLEGCKRKEVTGP